MQERAYTKRELDLKFISLEEKNDAWNASIIQKLDNLDKDKITPIFEQSRYHNGRLKRLEGRNFYFSGALSIIGLIILPAIAWLAFQILTNSGNIRELQTQMALVLQNLNRTPVHEK